MSTTGGFEAMEAAFPAGSSRRRAVAAYHGVAENDPALDALLLVSATYDLDPILGGLQLLPAKERGTDGEEGSRELKPHAGRDVLLNIARGRRGYRGLQFGVVCAGDKFTVKWLGKDGDPQVRHNYAAPPAADASGEEQDGYRGAILGAWARLRFEGEDDTFHYIPWGEKVEESDYWMKYRSEMILKAAQSYVCRIGCGIAGVVPSDEVAFAAATTAAGGPRETPGAETFDADFGESDELRARLISAIDKANVLSPNSWTEAKCQMVLSGRSDEERADIAEGIENEVKSMEEAAAAHAAGEQPSGDAAATRAEADAGLVELVTAADLAVGDVIRVGSEGLTITDYEKAAGDARRIITAGDQQLDVPAGQEFSRRRRTKAEQAQNGEQH